MSTKQFTGIQILRFVAAMLVVAMHTSEAISLRVAGAGPGPDWSRGADGVDIFFVISGFVMAMSTAELPTDGAARLGAAWIFVKRRLLRIAPLYWFYTLLKVAMVLAVPSLALRSSMDPVHLFASLFFIPAMSPWGLIQPTLPVGWTLNFEMLFYGVFALSIALGVVRIRFCLLVFALIFIAQYFFPKSVPLTFYSRTLVFEFILGMGIAHAYLNWRTFALTGAWAAALQRTFLLPPRLLAGLIAVLAGCVVMFGINWGESADRLLTWGTGAALMILGAVWLEPWTVRLPMASRLSFLGDASYSIYLSHTFAVPAAVMLFRPLGIQSSLVILPIVSLLAIVTGCFSYVWIERPMTRFFKRILFRSPEHPLLKTPKSSTPSESTGCTTLRELDGRYIYIACPWTPKGGGMYKVADYLIQAQDSSSQAGAGELRPLDTRGGTNAVYSLWFLAVALGKLVRGRLSGQLAGVHVNMAGRLSLFRKSAVVILSRTLGLPVVLHLHAQPEPLYHSLPAPLQALTRWVFSLPASCLVLGSAAQRFVIDELRVRPERVEIVINGVPEPRLARRIAGSDGMQRILFVGNLSDLKGVADLLNALALPGFATSRLKVTFAGGGDIEAYQASARQLGIDSFVHFEGWSDQQTVAQLMADADVLVLPSYIEGLPLVILEAMANGVAVVCTPVGEIPLMLADGVNACFVQPGDVAAIAAGLQRVLNEPEFREILERNGRALYEQRFSLSRFFANVAKIHQHHFGIAGQQQKAPVGAQRAPP